MTRAAGDVARSEFVSRGDRVPVRVWLPAPSAGPAPLCVFLAGSDGEPATDPDATPLALARSGIAAASWDLPLCGARRSPKLSELLWTGARSSTPRPEQRMLVEEVLRQGAAELSAALDHLATWPEIDAARSAAVGSDLAAAVIATCCAREERLRAIAIGALELPAFPLAAVPARALQEFAPRPHLALGGPPQRAIAEISNLLAAAFGLRGAS
jgi:hypothetical protein